MNIAFIVVFLAGFAFAWIVLGDRLQQGHIPEALERFNNRQRKRKTANKNRIMQLLEHKPRITNDDVERSIGVSDTTVARYLGELEAEGLVARHGENRGTFYTKKGPPSG